MMKRLTVFILILVLGLFLATPVFAVQDKEFDTSLSRILDTADWVDVDDALDLELQCLEFIYEHKLDLLILSVKDIPEEYTDVKSYRDALYTGDGYGYGADRDGLVLLIDRSIGKLYLKCFGNAVDRFQDDILNTVLTKTTDLINKGFSGKTVISRFIETVAASIDGGSGILSTPEPDVSDGNFPRGGDPSLPDWYPTDKSNLKNISYHDPKAPRVVDRADIFSDEQETQILKQIEKLRDEQGYDAVIVTDVSSYGLAHKIYAADFHQFNGYGFGDDHTGTLLFICMDPENRGFWNATCGKSIDIFADEALEEIEDELYEYMSEGKYTEGVLDYINNLAEYYYSPEWYPENGILESHHNESTTPRVVDNAKLLTAEHITELNGLISNIRDTYGIDVLILTEEKTIWNTDAQNHGKLYFQYNGYGLGEPNKGIVLCIKKETGSVGSSLHGGIWLEGYSGDDVITNRSRLHSRFSERLTFSGDSADTVFKNVKKSLKDIDTFCETGTAPKNYDYSLAIVFALGCGIFCSIGIILFEKSRMKSIKKATTAQSYIVPGSFKKQDISDTYSHSTTSQRERTKNSSSSGGSGSSGSYSSSGGRSYGGSGRSF